MKYYIGGPVVYGLDYHDAEYHEQERCGFDDPRGCYVDYLEGVNGHDCVTTLGDIPQDSMLVKSTSEVCDKRFFDPRNLMGSDAGFDHQHTQIGRISKRRPDKRKGAKGKNGRIKRCHVHEPRNGYEEIETRPTHGMQYLLMGDSSRSLVCATFRGEKKRSRRKQHNVCSAKLSKYITANAKHLDGHEDFTGPKTLAQIKEEKCRSKSSFSHPTVRVSHGRSFSNDFEGPKSLSELLEAKGRTSVDKGIMM
uniref:Uncharacterized protein n=1 Tax=Arundo donax TaxID=35708 RepID=A0A0A9E7I1_ARUDO